MTRKVGWAVLLSAVLLSCVKSHRDSVPAFAGLEGAQWELTEVGGSPLVSLPEDRRPFIRFDAAKKQAAGFAGCNNFFCSYEMEGSSVKMGPVAATRRACPDPETALETEFFHVLDRTRGFEIRNGVLLLTGNGGVLARFSARQRADHRPDLESMTFLSSWFSAGRVTLAHGECREPAAPGSASEITVRLSDKRAFGPVNGRETVAAVLITSAGGTGTFYDLALLMEGTEGWTNTDTIFLGDRVKVHSVEIEDNHIVVRMTAHGANDPMCCPTHEMEKRFVVKDNHLVSLDGKED